MVSGSGKKRILVVCGEPRVLAEIKMGLKDRFEVGIAAEGDSALAALAAYGARAVIIHIGASREEAFSAFACVAAYARRIGAPVLFLAERDNERDEAAAFKIGAADYSVRRQTGAASGSALSERINLRVRAAENERRLNADTKANTNTNTKISPAAPAKTPEELLAGKTILIAEDIVLNQAVIAGMLADVKDLTLEFASDGAEALECVRQNAGRYALVFMDIYMPEMDGLTAAKAIRNLVGEAARIPIVALTAGTEEEEIEAILEAGMNGYLKKPMEYESFLSICAEYCGKN